METFIIVVGLLAGAGGCLVLLACLAGERAQLIEAYNIELEAQSRDKMIEQKQNVPTDNHDTNDAEELLTVTSVTAP